MQIIYDQRKRDRTLQERGLDMARAAEVWEGPELTTQDTRVDYGEARFVTVGFLDGRLVFAVWTPRQGSRRIISLRKANEREQKTYLSLLGQ